MIMVTSGDHPYFVRNGRELVDRNNRFILQYKHYYTSLNITLGIYFANYSNINKNDFFTEIKSIFSKYV